MKKMPFFIRLHGIIISTLLVAQESQRFRVWDQRYGGSSRDTGANTIHTTDNSLSGISGNKSTANQGNDDWCDFNFGRTRLSISVHITLASFGDQSDRDVNIPYYDEQKNEIYLSRSTNSALGDYLSTENFGASSDFWMAKFQLKGIEKDTC